MDRSKKVRIGHIVIIILGIIFTMLSIFHTNFWFDESYSIGIAKKSFAEIWQITSHDVHPVFYYYCLHVLYLIFGSNVIIYRLFSAICIAITGLLGYTHIRKDFGEKVGILFSFLVLMIPASTQFAGEIRMYSLGMLLGTLLAIYAYRIYKGKITKSTYVIFGVVSLLGAYTHYYGLMLSTIINVVLFIYLLKNRKDRKKDLITFMVIAVIQVALYLPWIVGYLANMQGGSFWITLKFPDTIYDILTIQLAGNLSFQPIIISTAICAYFIYRISQTPKEERKPGIWGFMIYISVIVIALIVSWIMHSVILLNRYLIIATGILIFAMAFFMAKDPKKWRVLLVCVIITVLSTISNIQTISQNYNSSNRDFMEYIDERIGRNDIIIYSNAINGEVITTEIAQKYHNMSYFYNKEKWGVEEAYKAFPNMEIKDTLQEILDNYQGRIWIIESADTHELYDEIANNYDVSKLDEAQFVNEYKDYQYTIELVEKTK